MNHVNKGSMKFSQNVVTVFEYDDSYFMFVSLNVTTAQWPFPAVCRSGKLLTRPTLKALIKQFAAASSLLFGRCFNSN
jgi:hypothetical protein